MHWLNRAEWVAVIVADRLAQQIGVLAVVAWEMVVARVAAAVAHPLAHLALA